MSEKIKEWLKRYIPAEISGTIGSMAGAGLIFFLTKNRILAAYIGSIGESIGYYGFIVTREYFQDSKNSKNKGDKYGPSGFFKTIRNLIAEFGLSEFLDSFVVRPFCMYLFPLILNQFALGIFVGKIVADIIFYIPTIIMYEILHKKQKDHHI